MSRLLVKEEATLSSKHTIEHATSDMELSQHQVIGPRMSC